MTDVLSTLPAPSWRGIPFPLSGLSSSFSQEHAIHAFIYRDGVHVESTGRSAFVFHLSIPFCNGVRSAPNEPWAGQILYPTLFRKFLNACTDKTTGTLVHPDLGAVQCKSGEVRWETDPGLRDGVRLTATLTESVDGDELNQTISSLSALTTAQQSAGRLDSLLENDFAATPMPELANDTDTFGDMMTAFVTGTASLGRVQSKIDSLTGALTRLNNVNFWPLALANEDLRAAVIDLNAQPAQSNRPIRTFVAGRDMPLMTIAITLGVKSSALVTLNPKLARDPLVRSGTRVQYELAA